MADNFWRSTVRNDTKHTEDWFASIQGTIVVLAILLGALGMFIWDIVGR